MNNKKIAIIGLGYVGLPLAVEFGKKFDTIGFDTNLERIQALNSCNDITLEIDSKDLEKASRLSFTNDEKNIIDCNIYCNWELKNPIWKEG